MISRAIVKAFSTAQTRNWDTIFVAVDVHDTIVVSNYSEDTIPTTYYAGAKETLQYLSERPDVVLIMFTSSNPKEVNEYFEFFASEHIHFMYNNCNPEVPSAGYGCYDRKFYFNVLIEDKAGFDATKEWEKVLETFKRFPILKRVQ